MTDIQVLVLAGGVGKRMWPITTNKNLLPFFGRPLISHQIEGLKRVGFKNFIVVVSPEIKDLIKIKGKIVVQEKPLGQADAILAAEKEIQDAPLLIINANDFFKPNLFTKLREKIKSNFDVLLAGLATDHYLPMGYLVVEKGRVFKIVEKPGEGKEPSKIVRLVVDFFKEPQVLFQFLRETESQRDDAYEVTMATMMKKGIKFGLVEYKDSWATIKYPWDILKMTSFFLEEKKKKPVVLEREVKIFEGGVIKNSYLGKNVIVGNNALVRDSIVEEGCVIGFNTEIVRSYIGSDCWFHANYIGDSVLERNISFGSGARTGNLRLDEKEIIPGRVKLGSIIGKDARVGINASLMPGVMIGAESFVGPGLVLGKNLEEGKFCYLKQKLVIKKNIHQVSLKKREKFRRKL